MRLRKVAVRVMILPPVAMKVPYIGFDNAKLPPLPTVTLLTVTALKEVNKGTTEKSPAPEPDVSDPVENCIVLVSRLVPFWLALTITNGREPEMALARITPLAATRKNRANMVSGTDLVFISARLLSGWIVDF